MQPPVLVWFRDDLRLADNEALNAAARSGRPVIALYVLDDETTWGRPLGGAARWWLAGSLRALSSALAERGVRLLLKRGAAAQVVPRVVAELGAGLVTFNHRTGPAEVGTDAAVTDHLQASSCAVLSFPGHLLHAPGSIATKNGNLPRTFFAFFNAARKSRTLAAPLPAPAHLNGAAVNLPDDFEPADLEPHTPDWAAGLRAAWQPGEEAAHTRLDDTLSFGLNGYAEGRDFPAAGLSSGLSPHLRFGELSPRQVLHALYHHREAGDMPAADAEKFEAEIYWREFAHHLMFAFPHMGTRNLQTQFNVFPWRTDPENLRAWQKGQTGYPLVDAGMRQLWQTGWMHNRVRMVVASFLTKHLLIDWRVGEAWFYDTLVDADAASNAANWQWVAGTGMDAAPYFRIFNPVLQSEKFDPDGEYIRTYVPELAKLPNAALHRPWAAGAGRLVQAGVKLGETYPHPIVDHDAARARALLAFKSTQN